MVALLALLLPLVIPDPGAPSAPPTDAPVATPAVLAKLPADVAGRATGPGACTAPRSTYGIAARAGNDWIARMDPGEGRIGSCGQVPAPVLRRLAAGSFRSLAVLAAPPADARPLADLVAASCINRDTLRPYGSLVVLGPPLDGFVIDLAPSRNVVHARLYDARKTPAEVYPLGKIGVRTLEWCDRTDVAEGHCPNPTHGEVRHVAVADGELIITATLGFADVCGLDDLVVKSFPLPPAARRALK